MTHELFAIMKEVITNYMGELTVEECREYALNGGLTTRNSKLRKGENYNVGLELLPDSLSGTNLCAGAGECIYSCLAFAGLGNILTYKRIYEGGLPVPIQAKCKRTKLFLEDRPFFEQVLSLELDSAKRIAHLRGAVLGVRLNTTSDVDWTDFISAHADIQFYDYTKVFNRKSVPNYHVTYSASEKTSENMIRKLLADGKNVAMIFHHVPTSWRSIPVVSGDDSDNRYDDARGIIVGLKYKKTLGVQETNLAHVF